MEFELHGVKFNYEYSNIYRLWNYKKGDEWREIKIHTGKNGYKVLKFMVNKKKYSVYLHRLVYWLHNPEWDIMDSSMENHIDHIDGDKLNNNIENLRVVTSQENHFNETRAKGYIWYQNKWMAYIRINNKQKYLGYFDNELDARNAYLEAKKKYHIIKS